MASPYDALSPEDQAYAAKVEAANPGASPADVITAVRETSKARPAQDTSMLGTAQTAARGMGPIIGGIADTASVLSSQVRGEPPDQSSSEAVRERTKANLYTAPPLAAEVALPSMGPLSILGRTAINAGGAYGVAKAVGDDPLVPTALAGGSSLLGGIAGNIMNRWSQGGADTRGGAQTLRDLLGYGDIPNTPTGMSDAVTPSKLPGSVLQRAGRDLATDITDMARVYGDPHVTVAGQQMRFSQATELVQRLGQQIDRARLAQAGEPLEQAMAARSAAVSDIDRSLRTLATTRGGESYGMLADEYQAANDMMHRRGLGVRVMTDVNPETGTAPLTGTGRYDPRSAQLNVRDRVESGDVNTQTIADILRGQPGTPTGIRRGAEGWNDVDQPGTLSKVLAWLRATHGGIGASASLPSLLGAQAPSKIGTLSPNPMTPVVSPGISLGITGLYNQLRSIMGPNQ